MAFNESLRLREIQPPPPMPLRQWDEAGERLYITMPSGVIYRAARMQERAAELRAMLAKPPRKRPPRWPEVRYYAQSRMRAALEANGRRTRWVGRKLGRGLAALCGGSP